MLSSLKTVFKVVAMPLLTMTFGFATGIYIDMAFLSWIHDPINVVAQAASLEMEGWRDTALYALGLEGDGPLSGLVQDKWLGPAIAKIKAEIPTLNATKNLNDMLANGFAPGT